jgi:hypothetical protein
MKPIKSAEEFQALLAKALAKHEKSGLNHVSLKILSNSQEQKVKQE